MCREAISVSYIGYSTQRIAVNGRTAINVTMKEDDKTLNEVVVVGYGTMRKKDLTGSVVQIDPNKIADQNRAQYRICCVALQVCRLVSTHPPRAAALPSSCVVRTRSTLQGSQFAINRSRRNGFQRRTFRNQS